MNPVDEVASKTNAHGEGSHSDSHGHGAPAGMLPLAVGALGVVFGDIGTSPLYAMREAFEGEGHELEVNSATVLGACSLAFWALLIIISVKYLFLVMRADNKGEGGILALTALIAPSKNFRPGARRKMLVMLGLFGCALLYGDGIITPAISVLSAVEGFTIAAPGLKDWVIPVSLLILVGLFMVQKRGTGGIGKVFGPVMLVWFTVLGILGLSQLIHEPSVLKSINPIYGVQYFQENGLKGFLSLGSIFLVVTGGEALYADMGHFGRKPIAFGWFSFVLPMLMLNYWGQGALLLEHPEAIVSPLFEMGPKWSIVPLAILATVATVIASQALISGAFSMTAQAVQLDYLPRVAILHTSSSHAGQIYIPVVNWLLMVSCLATVIGFQTSSNLAAAYGIAVTSTMAITTLLLGAVAVEKWGWSRAKALAVVIPLMVIDLSFLGANLVKIPHGGWFPLAVGVSQLLLMATWKKGRELVAARIRRGERSLADFVAKEVPGLARVPGVGVFLFKDPMMVPPAMIANVRHQKVLHDTVLIVSVLTEDEPRVAESERAVVSDLGSGVSQIVLHYGFMDEPDVPKALQAIQGNLVWDASKVTYFLGRETVISAAGEGMNQWRERLFSLQNQTASSAGRFFNLPPTQVYEVGAQVEI